MQKKKLSIKQILIVLLLVFSLFGILKPLKVQAAAEANGWLAGVTVDANAVGQANGLTSRSV